ncbi:glycoside hydrolase family 31 protein [Mariniluteicoccus flavus]
MKILRDLRLVDHDTHKVVWEVDGRHRLTVAVLDEHLFRVWLQPDSVSLVDRTWLVAPEGDVPFEGRDRASLDGFPLPSCTISEDAGVLTIATDRLRVRVQADPVRLEWEHAGADAAWAPLVHDRVTGAYAVGRDGSVHHWQDFPAHHRYFGLGEKAGDLERTGRRFELRGLDAMGYDAGSTDPLYKHVPVTITAPRVADAGAGWAPFGMLYDNLATSWFDLGNEIDNYHRRYRTYTAECGDLDYYLWVADGVEAVTREIPRLTGRTCFPPKWSLGYSGSTMHYTDAPNASEQLLEFIDLCREHDIPCDSFQLSSGYTSIAGKRYVFHWNRDKFPEPRATTAAFAEAGIHLAANIKPCLLHDHPAYADAEREGLFLTDPDTGAPERSPFWDDWGSHLDMTNPATIRWWQGNVTSQLLELGIGSTWNDNNEYPVTDGAAVCDGFGRSLPVKAIRPLHPLLMNKASREAQEAYAPDARPYLITRSGPIGLQRYAQTWSGDNRTSWRTLRYNTRMGVGMSMSGLYNIGHDVGGFSGDRPDPELFVRWVQNGVMHPRFTIHSWNDDHTVNEPWMYADALPAVRDAIALRYRLLPYLYTLLWRAAAFDDPMLRPVFFDFPDDPGAWEETDDFLLGKEILVASVVEPRATTRRVRLPAGGAGWIDWHTGEHHASGQTITLDAPLDRLPLLVRAGGAIPMSERIAHVDPAADTTRTLRLFPAPASEGTVKTEGQVFEDDGVGHGWTTDDHLVIDWTLTSTPDAVTLGIAHRGAYAPPWGQLRIAMPEAEQRPLTITDPEGLTCRS